MQAVLERLEQEDAEHEQPGEPLTGLLLSARTYALVPWPAWQAGMLCAFLMGRCMVCMAGASS